MSGKFYPARCTRRNRITVVFQCPTEPTLDDVYKALFGNTLVRVCPKRENFRTIDRFIPWRGAHTMNDCFFWADLSSRKIILNAADFMNIFVDPMAAIPFDEQGANTYVTIKTEKELVNEAIEKNGFRGISCDETIADKKAMEEQRNYFPILPLEDASEDEVTSWHIKRELVGESYRFHLTQQGRSSNVDRVVCPKLSHSQASKLIPHIFKLESVKPMRARFDTRAGNSLGVMDPFFSTLSILGGADIMAVDFKKEEKALSMIVEFQELMRSDNKETEATQKFVAMAVRDLCYFYVPYWMVTLVRAKNG